MMDERGFVAYAAWLNAAVKVIVAARMVVAFDGTDRISLEALRDAIFEFGRVEAEIAEMMPDAD